MKIKTKIIIGLGFIIALFGATSILSNYSIKHRVIDIVEVSNPKRVKSLEMEINLNESFRHLLRYMSNTENVKAKQQFEEDVSDYKNYREKYGSYTLNEQEKLSLKEVDNNFDKFIENSNDLIINSEKQQEFLSRFYNLISVIDSDLDTEFEKNNLLFDAGKKEAFYEIEVNINEFSSALKGYLLSGKIEFKDKFYDSINDLNRWKDRFNSFKLSRTEKIFFDSISEKIKNSFELGEKVISLEDEKQNKVKFINQLVLRIDDIIDDKIQTFAQEQIIKDEEQVFQIFNTILFVILGIIFISVIFGLKFSNTIVKSLNKLKNYLNRFNKGNLDLNIDIKTKDEIEDLSKTLENLVESSKKLTISAERIGKGDFDTDIEIRSNEDTLGKSLFEMKSNLKESTIKNQNENWLKTKSSNVNEICQGKTKVSELANDVIENLARTVGAGFGIFYSIEQNAEQHEYLKLVGSYAFKERKNLSNEIKVGEGLVGQCAIEGEQILLSNVPDDYIQINSGLGEKTPLNIVVTPFKFEEKVFGIIELGSFTKFTDLQLELIENVCKNLGIVLNGIRSREKTDKLLVETKKMAEELQSQQEELKAANEELEEQTNSLKLSREELTQQKEELQAINEELEEKNISLEKQREKIKEKNEEVEKSKKNLEQKAKELELSSKYKSEFLANMSHELRTPLNSLLILSETLAANEDGNLTTDQIEMAKVINGGGKSLLNLINDILDLSKVEAGKMSVDIKETKVFDIIEPVKQQLSPMAKDKQLELKVINTESAPEILHTDGDRVGQILTNLMTNAIKFTDKGSVTLEVGLIKQDPNTAYFSVIDTGVGIPEDKKVGIFEAFQQVDGGTKRKYGGTGLGLTISQKFANLLGGKVEFVSELNKGSTFTLYLPAKINASINSNITNEQESSKPKKIETEFSTNTNQGNTNSSKTDSGFTVVKEINLGSPDKNSVTSSQDNFKNSNSELNISSENTTKHNRRSNDNISRLNIIDDRDNIGKSDRVMLVIEDNNDFAKILKQIAQNKGFKCLIAGRGADGIELASKYKPNGVILDLGLPDMDGLEVLDRIKANKETRNIPIHLISGQDKVIPYLEKGAIGYFTKPVSLDALDALFSKIETLVNKSMKNILVIDDDESTLVAIRNVISTKGVEITTASSGKEGLEKIINGDFDSIILDLQLPDLSGIEIIKSATEQISGELPPVVIYTAKELSEEEYKELRKYTSNIIIKGSSSTERLRDESTMFLQNVEKDISNIASGKSDSTIEVYDEINKLKGKRLLLVDDDLRNTFAITKALQKYGLDIVIADNGKLAVEKLNQDQNFDVVIMDIMMPVMDGYEAITAIRNDSRFNKLPIIALTAKAMPEDKAKCFEVGANDYLAKPVKIEELVNLIKLWIFNKNENRELREHRN